METDNGSDSILCQCPDPIPGDGEHGDHCRACGKLIGGAIIGGEVHAGYTSLGNGQAFFDDRESWRLNSGSEGKINRIDEGSWFRSFAHASVVVPYDCRKARTLGTESISFDHVVHPDGEVELIVANRKVEDLPDGPKFP